MSKFLDYLAKGIFAITILALVGVTAVGLYKSGGIEAVSILAWVVAFIWAAHRMPL